MFQAIDQEYVRAQLKAQRFVLEKREASPEVRKKLPANARILAYVYQEDQDGIEHEAMVVWFSDDVSIRIAYFRLDTGDYMSDWVL